MHCQEIFYTFLECQLLGLANLLKHNHVTKILVHSVSFFYLFVHHTSSHSLPLMTVATLCVHFWENLKIEILEFEKSKISNLKLQVFPKMNSVGSHT